MRVAPGERLGDVGVARDGPPGARRAPRALHRLGRAQQHLRRHARPVRALARDELRLHDRHALPRLAEHAGADLAAGSGTDHDRVVVAHDGSSAPDCSATRYAAYHSGQSVVLPGDALLVLAVGRRRAPERARQVARGAERGDAGVDAAGEAGGDLLEQPAVAVRVAELGVRAVALAVRRRAAHVLAEGRGAAAEVEHLAHLRRRAPPARRARPRMSDTTRNRLRAEPGAAGRGARGKVDGARGARRGELDRALRRRRGSRRPAATPAPRRTPLRGRGPRRGWRPPPASGPPVRRPPRGLLRRRGLRSRSWPWLSPWSCGVGAGGGFAPSPHVKSPAGGAAAVLDDGIGRWLCAGRGDGRGGERQREAAPAAGNAVHGQVAAQEAGQAAADRQAEPGAAVRRRPPARTRRTPAPGPRPAIPTPVSRDVHRDGVRRPALHGDPHPAALGELDRVGQQVEHDLPDPLRVGAQRGGPRTRPAPAPAPGRGPAAPARRACRAAGRGGTPPPSARAAACPRPAAPGRAGRPRARAGAARSGRIRSIIPAAALRERRRRPRPAGACSSPTPRSPGCAARATSARRSAPWPPSPRGAPGRAAPAR